MSNLNEERQTFRSDGSAPARLLDPASRKNYRTKVFKSGNSLAVRIPAGTDLKPGMEMDLIVEDGVMLSLKPIDAPKRKIDVSGFWGKAPWLKATASRIARIRRTPQYYSQAQGRRKTVIRYLIDADTAIYALSGRFETLRTHFANCDPGEIGISVISFAEIALGSTNGKPPPPDLLESFCKSDRASAF